MKQSRAIASSGPKIGNYDLTLPAAVSKNWRHKSVLKVACTECDTEGYKDGYVCPECKGKRFINPYIYDCIRKEQTRSIKITFNNELFAWAMAGSPDEVFRMMMCKYVGGDGKDNALLTLHAIRTARSLADKKKWVMNRPELLSIVADTALREVMALHTCERCKGRGEVTEQKKLLKCPPPPRGCDGTGRRPWSMRKRASKSKIDRHTFKKTWQQKYMQLLSIYTDWENEGLSRLYFRLKED